MRCVAAAFLAGAVMPGPRTRRYPTDLSNTEWAALVLLLPPPARTGRPLKWPRRLMAEAIFQLVRVVPPAVV